jgi:DegV family protein with EDD domain
MRLTIAGASYEDGIDLTTSEFYAMLKQAPGDATTSSPSPAAFLEALQQAAEGSDSTLCIVVAAQFSATADSASTAIGELRQSHPDHQVVVMDSESAAGGQGLIATAALRQAEAGAPLAAVLEAGERVRDGVRLLAFVDTLYYLWKGGRVPRLAHAGASLLKLKPTFELHRAQIATVARPRTGRRAVDKLVQLMADRVDGARVHVAVMHAASEEGADALHDRITREFDCSESYVAEFSPVMGAHIGPGMLGVAFWSEGA